MEGGERRLGAKASSSKDQTRSPTNVNYSMIESTGVSNMTAAPARVIDRSNRSMNNTMNMRFSPRATSVMDARYSNTNQFISIKKSHPNARGKSNNSKILND
jgi:hypothetical protein